MGLGAVPLWSIPAFAQQPPVINCQGRPVTALEFSGSILESGTANSVGAVYRFTNVAPAVDARIEVIDFVNGGSLNIFDNDSGLVSYFQPELISTGGSAVDFEISFVDSANNPIALDIAASAIDIDGNGNPVGTLREYAEFERTLAAFVLNNATELDVDASGPSGADRIRFESRTTQFAPGIDPTAENNIVTTFYTDVTSFEYRIGTVDAGGGTRLTSLGFDCPNLASPVMTPMIDQDYGDAPLNNYGNPIHTIIPGIQLGASNSTDNGPFDSATASGDGGDDGVTLPDFLAGETRTINLDVSGAGGFLQAWIDWNGDGDILDAGEQIATDIQDTNNDGIIPLNVTAPLSTVEGNSIARFRWSTVQGVSFQEAALDGEVEDYQITLSEPTPFDCDGTLYQVGRSNSTLLEQTINQVGSSYQADLVAVDSAPNTISAGWGYNELDDLIYGVRNATRELWRVDEDGRFTQMSTIPNTAPNGGIAGDILPNGQIIYRRNNSIWGNVDISDPLNPIFLGQFNLSPAINVRDIGYNPIDGLVYGVDRTSDRLFYADITAGSGALTPVRFGPAVYSGNYQAVWFDEDGNFYLYENQSNQILMVDVGTSGNGLGEPLFIATSSGDDGGTNDGAYCRGPAPLPLGSIAGTLYEDANGDNDLTSGEASLGADILLELYDNGGTPADPSDDILVRRVNTQSDGSYIFGSQRTIATYRVEVDTGDTDIPATLTIGTDNPINGLSVTANVTNSDNDFGFDVAAAELAAEKTVASFDPQDGSETYMLPGNDVVYSIEISNIGNLATDADTLFLVDSLPPEIEFWSGDLEDGAPDDIAGTDPIALVQADGAALTYDYLTDIGVSTSTTRPTSFADCDSAPTSGTYLPAIRHICFNPKGSLASGSDIPKATFKFRARIK